jgi:hypothetical protein
MKTIVWRPGTPANLLRPTTAQQGRPFTSSGVGTGVQLDGELIASVPDTLIVADAGDVSKQVRAWGGDCELVIDTSLAPAVLPAGMVLPGFGLDPVTGALLTSGVALLRVRGAQAFTQLRITDTAQILGVLSLEDIDITAEVRTAPAIAIGGTLTVRATVLRNVAGALFPVIRTPDSYVGEIDFGPSVFLDNAVVAHPIIQFGSTGGDPGAAVNFRTSMGYSQLANAITAAVPANATVGWFHDASVADGYFATQNPLLAAGGGVTDTGYGGSAADAAYTPAAPGNWVGPPPTTVKAALDRMAANIPPVTPIP